MDVSTKVTGKIITSKVKGMKNSLIYQFTMVLIKKENLMDMENINGKMAKIIKVSGLMDKKMVQEYGGGLRVTLI